MNVIKVSFFLIFLFGNLLNTNAQEKLQVFYSLIEQNDTSAVKKHLEEWNSENSEDPELYIAYFNFYFYTSRIVEMQVIDNPEDYPLTQIINTDSAQNEKDAIHAIPKVTYDRDILNKGFSYINSGISNNPDRLDMRFGKVFIFNMIEDFESSKEEIIRIISHSIEINNNWLWANNKKLDNPKESMLGTIQDYIITLTQSSDSNYFYKIEQISETILKHYPNHITSLSNLSNVYELKKNRI